MMNEFLLGDEHDVKIASLNLTIQRFKDYDKKRKQYYAEKMQRLGELESYVQELESKDTGKTIAKLTQEVKSLNMFIKMHKIKEVYTPEEVDDKVLIHDLKAEVKALRHRNEVYKESIDILSKRLESVNK